MSDKNQMTYRRRGVYLLPNLFTTAALFSGFYSVVAAMRGLYELAAIAIFIAMILDTLDGRVARITRTQTAFGGEYDSLSDMVAFGIAPALVTYSWTLIGLGKLGWLVAFIYTATVALRLARFNTQVEQTDKRYFIGLPCPSGAAILAGMVWLGSNELLQSLSSQLLVAIVSIVVSLLMVSNIPYYSFKDFDLQGRVPFVGLLVLIFIFVGISLDPPQVLFLIFSGYVLSGPLMALMNVYQRRKKRRLTEHSHDSNTTH